MPKGQQNQRAMMAKKTGTTPSTPVEPTTDRVFDKLYQAALSIEEIDALSDGSLGFMARAMVQATLPHREVEGPIYSRSNGEYKLSISNPDGGIPFGTIPRLVLSWVTTEAVKTGKPSLVLGDSLTGFMRELDMVPTGGRWGSITRLKEQVRRLTTSHIQLRQDTPDRFRVEHFHLFDAADIWWTPVKPDQSTLFESTLTLNKAFFDEVTKSPVPVDMRALKALKSSPMALDLYLWLTYRMSYLKKPADIPWEALRRQLGTGYADTPSGRQKFRKSVLAALGRVAVVYPEARVQESLQGLLIKPSPTSIKKKSL